MNETTMRKGTIMKRTTALALLGLACLMAVPNVAHARYRDGMNLYQYVQSRPISATDPDGRLARETTGGDAWNSANRGTYDRARKDGCCHMFTVKSYGPGLDLSGGMAFARSFINTGFSVGHVWVRIEDVALKEAIEGGHTGETGDKSRPGNKDAKYSKYWHGIYHLNQLDPDDPHPGGDPDADPANPIRWLRHVYQDGYWHTGDGGHKTVTAEATWCINEEMYVKLKSVIETMQSSGYLQAYGGFNAGCAKTAHMIAQAAGINVPSEQLVLVPATIPKSELGRYAGAFPNGLRLWTDRKYGGLDYHWPDKFADHISALSEERLKLYIAGRQGGGGGK